MALTLTVNGQQQTMELPEEKKPVVEETTAVTDIVATGEKAVVAGEQEMTADDLAWLNEEDNDFLFEDLFGEDAATLELENAKQLELKDAAENAKQSELENVQKLNGFEEGLVRLKKKRNRDEMSPEEASDLIEELLTKMATAADEDAQTIKSNLAKQKLQKMMDVEKFQKGFLTKNGKRLGKLYEIADFPDFKNYLKSYLVEIEKEVDGEMVKTKVVDSKKALNGSLKLLDLYAEKPAMSKISILKECVDQINNVNNQQWFVNCNGLNILKTWLSKNPDGSLPNLTLRTEILKCLQTLPIGKDKLRSSQLGKAVKALLVDQRETLKNRKICQGLIQKWLANVLETENSIKNHMEVQQHQLNQVASKKRKTMQKSKSQAELDRLSKVERARIAQKESNERRHPQMFGKANNVFRLLPKSEIQSLASEASAYRQTRKGRIGKTAGEMRALRPATKHMHVSISGGNINLAFSTYVGKK